MSLDIDQVKQVELTVEDLIERSQFLGLELQVLSGHEGLDREVRTPEIHRPGLALAAHFFHHHPERIQIFGETEMAFLGLRPEEFVDNVLGELASAEHIPCFIITKGLEPPETMVQVCARNAIPLLRTPHSTGEFIHNIARVLGEILAPRVSRHGVMVDVFGVGVLIAGPSGIGKSECALELVLRGHRLIADDMVEIHLHPQGHLVAYGPELIKHHMEIRGLGIINVQDLFGVAAVRDKKRLELVIHLDHWDPETPYDRVGESNLQSYSILGIEIKAVTIPVRPGRNLSEIIEVAARNHILKMRGVDSAQRFQKRLLEEISRARPATESTESE